MSEQFAVGEIVIGQNFIRATYHNGEECIIIAPLALVTSTNRETGNVSTEWFYEVEWSDGDKVLIRPKNLRRKPPPTTGEDAVLSLFRIEPRHIVAPEASTEAA